MIIDQPSEIVHNNTAHTADFSITTSPMLYKLLYTSLYEDKEKIVLQELAANALDAHILAGKQDTPISISLPTAMNPVLEVTDKGVGMDMQTLTEVYPVYGASTKRATNDQIGGFGLGSKSPFALSPSFTVKTTCQGVTTTVSCFLDNGQPKFSIFTSGEIGEEDGTTITVPITDEEVMLRMQNIVRSLYTLWDTPPTIHGIQSTPQALVTKEADHYLIEPSSGEFSYRYALHVAVGPYMYRVPDAIKDTIWRSGHGDKIKDLFSLREPDGNPIKVVPRFPIGILELSPSRENIEATKENTEKIEESLVKIITSVDKSDEFGLELYTEAMKIIDEKGLFFEGNSKKTFVGIDPEHLQPIVTKIFGGNPTKLQSLWAMESVFVNNALETAFKEMEEADFEKLSLLTHDTAHHMPSYHRKGSLHGRYVPYYNIGRVWFEGKTYAVRRYSNMLFKSGTSASLIRATDNGRPSISSAASLRGLGDLRGQLTLVSVDVHTVNRQKLYHWWRTNPGYEKQEILVIPEESHRTAIKWLDENFPRGEEKAEVFILSDVEAAWKNRPKPVRTSSSKSSTTVRTARQPDADTMYVGTIHYPMGYNRALNLGDLKAINKDSTYQIVITSRRVAHTHYSLDDSADKYKILDRKYFKGLPILDITATLLKRKSVRLEIERLQAQMPVYFEKYPGDIKNRLVVAPYKELVSTLDKILVVRDTMSMLNIPCNEGKTEALQYLVAELPQLFNDVNDLGELRALTSGSYVWDRKAKKSYLNLLSCLPIATATRLAYTTQAWEMAKTAPDVLTKTDKRVIISTINKLHKEGSV